mgnify:CR=1
MDYEFQTSHSGKCWVDEFLDDLNDKEAKKAAWLLKLIQDAPRRENIPSRFFGKVTGSNGIWEAGVSFGQVEMRFLGFFDQGALWLNHAFKKKTQQLRQQDIELAENRKREFYRNR